MESVFVIKGIFFWCVCVCGLVCVSVYVCMGVRVCG